MRYRFDQPPRASVRQLCIRIQRNHVADWGRRRASVNEIRIPFAAEKRIQLLQLAALPFPADPALFTSAPRARPVKECKAVAMTRVQLLDSFYGDSNKAVILRHLL